MTASSPTALQVLARTDIPLGIIPAGTGNDHAREFGIPTKDPEAAADIVVDGCDGNHRPGPDPGLPTARRQWFGTVMAAGFDSLVTDRDQPDDAGRTAGCATTSRWSPSCRSCGCCRSGWCSTAREEIDADLTLAAFGNTRSYGGGMLICPDADPTDGLLDITMVHVGVPHQAGPAVPHRVQGHPRRPRRGDARRGPKRSHVECPGINVYADGEFVCPLPAEVSAVPGALKILRPA